MAASVPVVATANSAAAFDARAGHDLLVARDSQEIATHILTLLDNADLRQRVGAAGRRYVERSHRWENSAARLESVYEQAAASLGSAPTVLQTSVQ
jgi:spore coat protein SA